MTDDGIKYLTNITSLDLRGDKNIIDHGIEYLTNLTCFKTENNHMISKNCIIRLKQKGVHIKFI